METELDKHPNLYYSIIIYEKVFIVDNMLSIYYKINIFLVQFQISKGISSAIGFSPIQYTISMLYLKDLNVKKHTLQCQLWTVYLILKNNQLRFSNKKNSAIPVFLLSLKSIFNQFSLKV